MLKELVQRFRSSQIPINTEFSRSSRLLNLIRNYEVGEWMNNGGAAMHFCKNLAEDPYEATTFDCDVLHALLVNPNDNALERLKSLQKKYKKDE